MSEYDKQMVQNLRLMLAMYNQGWRDAVAELQMAGKKVENQFKKDYEMLLEFGSKNDRT